MNIIGLGQAGCRVANCFKQYPQYIIYKIDVDLKGKNCFDMPFQKHPEGYEENCPIIKLRTFLKGVKGDVLFISSCGNISGSLLRILEQIKRKCNIYFLYIKPDRTLLNNLQAKQENLIFGVAQEYARSGVFERTYLVSNTQMSNIIGDVPIREYYNKINEVITSTFHMISVFNRSDAVISTAFNSIETAKISTFGITTLDSEEEQLFFNMEMPREKRYYYALPEKILESDGTLIKKIKKQLKNNIEHDKMGNSYAVFSTQYEQPYVYCTVNSTLVQKNKKNS